MENGSGCGVGLIEWCKRTWRVGEEALAAVRGQSMASDWDCRRMLQFFNGLQIHLS
jgi:hypothetical protein